MIASAVALCSGGSTAFAEPGAFGFCFSGSLLMSYIVAASLQLVHSGEKSIMRRLARGLASAALLAVAIAALSLAANAQDIPQKLQPPANEHLLFQLHAKGDQVYVCKNDGSEFAWTLRAPDAKLFDKSGKPFGKHFAGPSWEANDGSRVVGKAVANVPSPDANSVAWLLVTVVSHEGNGKLANVNTIQRVNTKDGKAPATGCDAAHADKEFRAPYSADYRFFAPK